MFGLSIFRFSIFRIFSKTKKMKKFNLRLSLKIRWSLHIQVALLELWRWKYICDRQCCSHLVHHIFDLGFWFRKSLCWLLVPPETRAVFHGQFFPLFDVPYGPDFELRIFGIQGLVKVAIDNLKTCKWLQTHTRDNNFKNIPQQRWSCLRSIPLWSDTQDEFA